MGVRSRTWDRTGHAARYGRFHASGSDADCGREASLLGGDLPSPTLLYFLFAVTTTSIVAVLDQARGLLRTRTRTSST